MSVLRVGQHIHYTSGLIASVKQTIFYSINHIVCSAANKYSVLDIRCIPLFALYNTICAFGLLGALTIALSPEYKNTLIL